MLRPFSRFCVHIGAIPESIIKSMSYEEQLIRLIKFLKETVLPSIDGNADAIEELQLQMVTLQNYVNTYFDNLDVQEEINNKLDDMAEKGILQEIISEYLNSKAIFGYNTVNDMKQASNLIVGSYAKTCGYYEKNDGGDALYVITDTIDQSTHQETLNNGLYATLIFDDGILNINSVGCYGDNTHDDTNKLQYAINLANSKNLKLIGNKNYLITDTITIPTTSNLIIEIKSITTNIGNKVLINLNHTRRSNITIGTINNTNKIAVPNISGLYNHQSAFLLHGTSYINIYVKNIINFVCGFTLYSTDGSGSEGCYYNKIQCDSANVFMLAHLFNLNGAVNGNSFNKCLHYIDTWENPNNLNIFTIFNDGHTTQETVYTNNHNVFNNLMVEKPVNDNNDYYVASLENASNYHINVDRIEILPQLDLTKLAIFNDRSNYNLILFNSAWFTIPYNKSKYGNNNIITSYTNYSSSLLPMKQSNENGFILSDNFSEVENGICNGHYTYYPRTQQVRINGIFRNNILLEPNTNYTFGNTYNKPNGNNVSTGIIYEVNGGNPTQFTPVGSIRQVPNQYYNYVRVNKQLAIGNYLYIDYIIE